ncbi:MAG: PAS domain S-box protein [Bacteroidales bacterium]|nr:PAS domain S-box protein [Bacteroidales bacterium]
MRRFEQHFLVRHSEDPNFFITGENTYIKKLKKTSSAITELIVDLSKDPISKELKLVDLLNEIKIIHQNYLITFNDLTEKIYKKGSYTTGITGDLKSSGEKTYKYASPSNKNRILKMIEYSDNYLYTNEEKYYTIFLKEYEKLIFLPQNNDTILEEQETPNSQNKFQASLSAFKKNFTALTKINKELGITYREGLEGDLRNLKFKPLDDLVQIVTQNKIKTEKKSKRNIYFFFTAISLLFFILFWRFSNSIVLPLNRLREYIKPLSLGVLPEEKPRLEGKNEISNISEGISDLVEGLKKTTRFAISIGQGEYDVEFRPLSESDTLGNALIEMRHNLIISRTEEEKRKQEDEIRTWTNVGLTRFNDILRQTQGNIKEMSTAIISNLVKFINANQGGMFVFSDDEDEKHLELTAAYAYGQEKKKQKTIFPGEGLVGTVAVEKETVYMTEIPETYITITSGLGESKPRSLLIVPMIVEEDVVGVIELASFNKLNKHEIDFVETLSENIASSLSITKINQRTARLFEQSQRQTELMKVQEEEMRQNYEELQQVQEDASGRAAEMTGILSAIDTSSFVIDINTGGTITSVNRALLELLGVSESGIVGSNHKDFIQAENEEEYTNFWSLLMSGENIQRNEHIVINDREFWFSVVYAPIIDAASNVQYILTIATDVSESKKLEIELKEQEQKLRQNIDEINKAHKEAERKQHILENTNEMLKANEMTLQSAVETAMKQRKELARKIEEIAKEEALISSRLEGINQTNLTFEIDLDGNIHSVNKIFEYIFKFTKKEIINTKIANLFNEQFIRSKKYAPLWEDLKSGKHVSGTFNFTGKNKQKIFLQGTFTVIKDQTRKTKNIFFVGFDTTDLVLKTEELKARETELFFQIQDMQVLQDQSAKQQEDIMVKALEIAEKEAMSESRFEGVKKTNIIAEFDKKGIILSVNDLFCKIFGYKQSEIISKNHEIIISKEFASSEQYKEAWDKLLKGEHISGEFPFIGKGNKKLFIQGTFTAIKNASGKTASILLIGFDNTELIRRTEELRARETELEFQLEELKQLQEKLKK